MSRFNIFVCCCTRPHHRGGIRAKLTSSLLILDFHGNHLYTLTLPWDYAPIVGGDMDHQIVFGKLPLGGGKLAVLNPVKGTLEEISMKELSGEEKVGYLLGMVEYPVDVDGRRSGGMGLPRVLWRRLK
ncbi:hypothetical protein HDV00_004688 [Rhizophlyctis rosea]|nr:hypothetical protein HDV00_004688 [Rhizophlyctis rosea]